MAKSSRKALRAIPTYSEPLPQCEGPKLHPFKDQSSPQFIRLLSGNDDDSENGTHAHVFEVSIGNKEFALKVFKFYDDEEDRFASLGGRNDPITLQLVRAHMDPFYNECRAYGRLIEGRVNGKVAVRCYGYVALPAEREEELGQKFDAVRWDRPEKEYAKSPSRREPFRAIVKEIIREDPPWTEKVAKKTLKDLKRIRRLGVYPMDICGRNYKGGLLVDMSIAMTKPHYLFDIRPPWRVKLDQAQDLVSWDSMMRDEKVDTWERAFRNEKYCRKLRSSKKPEDLEEESDEETDDDTGALRAEID